MRLQLRSAFLLLQTCCALAWVVSTNGQQRDEQMPLIQGEPIVSARARAARIAEFVSSHKIPDGSQRKDARLFERRQDDTYEQQVDEEAEQLRAHRGYNAHVDLENFGSSGLLQEEPARRTERQRVRQFTGSHTDEVINGVRVSHENPTTMLPVLTTQRDTRPFDFVPVNIIRDDAKGTSFLPFDNKNFEDVGDLNLVPAGSNTRIQVKKGPNGKDYEYEYVYYYYDEEDENKGSNGGATASNSQDAPTRTSAPVSSTVQPSRRGTGNRNRYSTLERGSSSTVEPLINEVLPNGNRARQLEAAVHEGIAEERLPTNTRFPPRSRQNLAVETTERTSRGRGNNRQRLNQETIDSSSFRSNQEGPEFPQNLPNGPVRFLGVTPNEGNEEKTALKARGRPQRTQEPAPVQESFEDYARKRPATGLYDDQEQPERSQGQFIPQTYVTKEEEYFTHALGSTSSSPRILQEDQDAITEYVTELNESPTTQVPNAMQKVALDLYAFLQQGRSNLVDFVKESDDDISTDGPMTEIPGTTLSDSELDEATSTVSLPTTTPGTITIAATTTTSSTTSSSTTSTTATAPISEGLGRPKFRRPGVGSSPVSRNRFKSSPVLSSPSSTEASAISESPTQRARGRFGGSNQSGSPSFKRVRPSVQKSPVEDPPIQKESAEKIVETKPAVPGRSRYRGTSARASTTQQLSKTTTAPEKTISLVSGFHRPAGLSKLSGINRRRSGRPGASTAAPTPEEGATADQPTSLPNPTQESSPIEPQRAVPKASVGGVRPKPLSKQIVKPGAGRLNLRPRLGALGSTTSEAPVEAVPVEISLDEPASEGTEEEHRQAAAETTVRPIPMNSLNKLRNRNRLPAQPRTTTARTPVPPASRRSPLLPRRRTTEAPAADSEPVTAQLEPEELESTEASAAEPSSSTTRSQEEPRGLSSLLAPRRRVAPRRPGQPVAGTTSE